MPALGVAQQTGTLLKWLKAEGQSVTKGEPLMEIETDKATVEIEAAGSGVLSNVTAKPGDQVPVGQTIAMILAPGEQVTTAATQSPPLTSPKGRGNKSGRPLPPPLPLGEGRVEGHATGNLKPSTQPQQLGGRLLASPKAKRIAKEQLIDLKSLRGSGPEGSILTADVLRAATGSAAEMPVASALMTQQIIPLTPMRRIVGQRMTQSKQSAPHFYISMDIDMTAVSRLREWKERGDESDHFDQ